jgi:hypothetical protein
MDNIIEPNDSFDFSKITLAHPVGIQGGAYFTKIELNKKPLYIQTCKSLTRQGFVKTGKKYYCDLMFDKNSEVLIHWFENLEEKCKKLIYEKKDAWFQGTLEENDIENAFNPLIRVYKSGKFYLLRTNIKNTKEDIPTVKIYNENEISLNMNDITTETELISILEIQGIKFTSRNFQIEIELKQAMVLDNEPIFESCLIKKNKKPSEEKSLEEIQEFKTEENIKPLDALETVEEITKVPLSNDIINSTTEEIKENLEIKFDEMENTNNSLEEFDPIQLLQPDEKKEEEDITLDIEFEDLTNDIEENTDTLREINNNDLNLDKTEAGITLKKPNQVYFELYKEARNKAKQAKKNAILAYLEAKNIKKTYLIENINDSDSDFDNEIDDVSESELEGL